jgi:hypothetical protein
VFQLLTQYFTGRKEEEKIWESWRDKYVPELVALLKVMRMEAAQKSAKKLSELRQAIDPLLPEDKREESFSRKALWTVASTPGVTSVLNGMRHPVYVEDSLGSSSELLPILNTQALHRRTWCFPGLGSMPPHPTLSSRGLHILRCLL